jgi:hydroxyacylglutathione hydrolase
MASQIKTIKCGGVNCYLAQTGRGNVLIDTGVPNKRADVERELRSAGCEPGNLKLILLTHGDYDHAGNAAYLRQKYGTKIAMYADDWGMVERGDMTWNRKAKPDRFSPLFRVMSFLLKSFVRPTGFDRFKPDLAVEDGCDLSQYGFDAEVLHLPGHSKGSIGVVTVGGDLFCGDLLANMGRPGLHFLIDDLAAGQASLARLKSRGIGTIYPGHGKPFRADLAI